MLINEENIEAEDEIKKTELENDVEKPRGKAWDFEAAEDIKVDWDRDR